MLDPHANFAVSTIAVAPSPTISGTSLVVRAGDGNSLFPDPGSEGAYNCAVWPKGQSPTKQNAEIVRVTARSGDVFGTIVRAQEGSNPRAIVVGDQIALVVSKKTIDDIASAIAANISTGSAAGGDLTGTFPNPTIGAGKVTAAKISDALKPSVSASAGTESLRALGATSSTAAAGNDARLSDARIPTGAAGGVLTGAYPNPAGLAADTVGAAQIVADSVGSSELAPGAVTIAEVAASLKPSGSAATSDESLRALGYGAGLATPSVDIGAGAKGGFSDVDGRLDDFDSRIAAIPAGPTGPAGKTEIPFGTALSTDPAVAGVSYRSFTTGVAITLLSASVGLDSAGSSASTFTVDRCLDRNASPEVWEEVYASGADRPIVSGGQKVSTQGAFDATKISVPAGGGVRARCVSAPVGGGTPSVIATATASTGSGTASTLGIPLPGGSVTGDVLYAFVEHPGNPQPTLTIPSGAGQTWIDAIGLNVDHTWVKNDVSGHNIYAYVLRHTYDSVNDQPYDGAHHMVTVSGSATSITIVTVAVRNGTSDVADSSTTVPGTSGLNLSTPASGAGTANGALILHAVFLRTIASTLTPLSGTRTWTSQPPPTPQAQVETSRVNAANHSISVASEIRGVSGASTPRQLAWASSCDRVGGQFVISPGATTAKGPIVSVFYRET